MLHSMPAFAGDLRVFRYVFSPIDSYSFVLYDAIHIWLHCGQGITPCTVLEARSPQGVGVKLRPKAFYIGCIEGNTIPDIWYDTLSQI